jgi:hypothetical protein
MLLTLLCEFLMIFLTTVFSKQTWSCEFPMVQNFS